MTARFDALTRPKAGADHRTPSRHRPVGFVLALVGLMFVGVTLILNIVNANSDSLGAGADRFGFGLTTLGFATIKLAIVLILIGIMVRLWLRVTAVGESLPALKAQAEPRAPAGVVSTKHGTATETADIPGPLPVHRMARTMWGPILAMGFMAVIVGFIVSLAAAGDPANHAATAWMQGLMFLGEGLLLAGISFLVGSILAALREGGGEVQKGLGLPVRTLKMPVTAKLFVGFMALGLMVSMLQFVLYIAAGAVGDQLSFQSWLFWLAPLPEFALGLLLAGIVLALVTIGNVLSFQFGRIREIIVDGS